MRIKLGDSLANAGRESEAACEYEVAAKAAATDEALDLRRRAAYQHLISGHFDAGCAAISAVLKAVGMQLPSTPWRALLSLLFNRARLRWRGLAFHERNESDLTAAERTRLDIVWSTSIGLGVIDIIRAADFQTRGLLLALKSGDPFTSRGRWRSRRFTHRPAAIARATVRPSCSKKPTGWPAG